MEYTPATFSCSPVHTDISAFFQKRLRISYAALVIMGQDILYSPKFHVQLMKDENYIEPVLTALYLNAPRWCMPWW